MRKRLVALIAVLVVVAGITATAAWALAFSDASYFWPEGIQGKPYSHQLGGRSGCPPYTYTVTSGSLPAGLQLNTSSGAVTGTPTQPGVSTFWIELADTGCPLFPTSRAQRDFTVTITAKLTVKNDSPMFPAAVNAPYTAQMVADGGGTQVWSLSAGALPPGMTLTPTGLLSGTPTTPGAYEFQVLVADAKRSDTKTLQLDVLTPLVIGETVVPPAEVGVPLTFKLNATGGKPPYAYTVTPPPGLTFSPDTLTVSGTPTGPGSFPMHVEAKDAYGNAASRDILVSVAGPLTITTQRLRAAKAGRAYQATIRTRGGVTPLKWKITSGRLPIGIRFDRKTGILAGTAKKVGEYQIEVTARDKFKIESVVTLVLTVKR